MFLTIALLGSIAAPLRAQDAPPVSTPADTVLELPIPWISVVVPVDPTPIEAEDTPSLDLPAGAELPAASTRAFDLPLRPGQPIRFSLRDGDLSRYSASTVEWDSYTLAFTTRDEESRVRRIDPIALDRIEIGSRSRARSAWRGALWGAFLGGSAGLISGPFASREMPMSFGASLATLGAGGGVAGALLGAAIGAVWAPNDWKTFIIERGR